jgi:hypothetical protein
MEASMLRPLAIAIGLAVCLSGSSAAYAAKPPKILSKGVSWAWEYLAQEWSYKNGKVILTRPIEFDLFGKHIEQSELDAKSLSGNIKRDYKVFGA